MYWTCVSSVVYMSSYALYILIYLSLRSACVDGFTLHINNYVDGLYCVSCQSLYSNSCGPHYWYPILPFFGFGGSLNTIQLVFPLLVPIQKVLGVYKASKNKSWYYEFCRVLIEHCCIIYLLNAWNFRGKERCFYMRWAFKISY